MGFVRSVTIFVLLAVGAGAAIAWFLDEWRGQRTTVFSRVPEVSGQVPIVGLPPGAIPISSTLRRRVANSVVRVSGTACDELQQGSGFVVRPGYVVTDAHVVAGEHTTSVIDHGGHRLPATVVRFDSVRDLALLRLDDASGQSLPPLGLATPHAPADYAVFGHPGGGDLRIAPARLAPSGFVDAVGRDIYGHSARGTRQLLALAARLAPGDSGAPVVDRQGRTVAVAFAIDPGGKAVAYALTTSEIRTVIGPAPRAAVSTGRCITL
jgi:S1-C subfamily serine protease